MITSRVYVGFWQKDHLKINDGKVKERAHTIVGCSAITLNRLRQLERQPTVPVRSG